MNLENVMKTIDKLSQYFNIDVEDINHNDYIPKVLYMTNKYVFIELNYRAKFIPNKLKADNMSENDLIDYMYNSEANTSTVDDYLTRTSNDNIHYVFDIVVQYIGYTEIYTFTSNNVDEIVLDIINLLNELNKK